MERATWLVLKSGIDVYALAGKINSVLFFASGGSGRAARNLTSNYAFKPIAEEALRSNQTIVPQRLNAALDVRSSGGSGESVS